MTGAANRSVWVCLAVSLAALGGLAGFARVAPSVALINESPSLPRGLYVRQPQADVTRGRIVAVPQPAPARPGRRTEIGRFAAATAGARPCRPGRSAVGWPRMRSFCSATPPGVSTAGISDPSIGPSSSAPIGRW